MATCPMPWFPMYAQELLADSDFSMWDPAARGCWLTLSARCWLDGDIPSDLSVLARLCGEGDAQAMLKHWLSISTKFRPLPNAPDRLFSPRVEEERELAILKAEKLKNRGNAGAMARWSKARMEKEEMLKHPTSIAKGMLVDATSPSPSPSPSPKLINEEDEPPRSAPGGRIASQKARPSLQAFADLWNSTLVPMGYGKCMKPTPARVKNLGTRYDADPEYFETFRSAVSFLSRDAWWRARSSQFTIDLLIGQVGRTQELAEKTPTNGVPHASKSPAHRAAADAAYNPRTNLRSADGAAAAPSGNPRLLATYSG